MPGRATYRTNEGCLPRGRSIPAVAPCVPLALIDIFRYYGDISLPPLSMKRSQQLYAGFICLLLAVLVGIAVGTVIGMLRCPPTALSC